MTINGNELLRIIQLIAPPRMAMEGDKTGLQLGRLDRDIAKVMITLDTTPAVVDEAVAKGVDLIISHHAIIFRPLQNLRTNQGKGALYEKLIKNDVAVYVPHTAMDIAQGGINDKLAELFSLKDVKFLKQTGESQSAVKIDSTNTPISVSTVNLKKAARISDESVYCCPTLNHSDSWGIGRIGYLETPQSLQNFAHTVMNCLNIDNLRIVGDAERQIKKVALLCGDGNRFVSQAIRQGADVMVTGDVYYHTALDALNESICLIDPGHNATERIAGDLWKNAILKLVAESKNDNSVEVIVSEVSTEPFQFIKRQS